MNLLVQFFILIILIIFYYLPLGLNNRIELCLIIGLVVFSSLLVFKRRKKTNLAKKMITVSSIFFVVYFIVNFQISIDYILQNPRLNFNYFFFDLSQISRLSALSGSCLVAYNIGNISGYNSFRNKKSQKILVKSINEKPILYLCLFAFLLFIITMNKAYINGGHGVVQANPTSLSFYGLYQKFSLIYLACIYYNYQSLKFKDLFSKTSILFIVSIIISILLFLSAHNRVYVIYLFIPICFLVMRSLNVNIRFIPFLVLFVFIGLLSTAFKIFDIRSLFSNAGDVLSSVYRMEGIETLMSYSPFTGELAFSVFASSILLSLYDAGYSFYGISFLTGILKIFPGLVSLFMTLFGLTKMQIDTGIYITEYMNSSFGLGTNCVGDTLINIGFIPSVIFFFFVGKLFSLSDLNVFHKNQKSFIWILVWLTIASFVVFLPRGSFSDLIGLLGFNTLFGLFYIKIKIK